MSQTKVISPQQAQARAIAFYLPQFHPTPENDRWWGKGFTEWTNTAKAKPRFSGHYQPHVPADLGFYDLRVPETRIAQAELARASGIEAFCYYHYWFAGKKLLHRPFEEVLASRQPDFPFCLCWANQTWSGIWHGEPKRVLIEQTYPGIDDHRAHFEYLKPAFADPRYLKVAGRPLFLVYAPTFLPDAERVLDQWRSWCVEAGLPELFIAGVNFDGGASRLPAGFDAAVMQNFPAASTWYPWDQPVAKISRYITVRRGMPTVVDYAEATERMLPSVEALSNGFPTVVPNWDNSPRSGHRGLALHDSTPEKFRQHLRNGIALLRDRPLDLRILFVKSWNEWAEGNHLEPDLRFGHEYLRVCSEELQAEGLDEV